MSKEFDAIMKLLPGLSGKEKTKLIGVLKLQGVSVEDVESERQQLSRPATAREPHKNLFLREVINEVSKATKEQIWLPPSLPPSIKTPLDAADSILTGFLSETMPKATRKARLRLYGLIARLAVERLEEVGAPVSVKAVLNLHGQYIGLLDRAFPGYAGSGLLHHILMPPSKNSI